MKKEQAVHNNGFVALVRNKHQQFNSKIYSCGTGDDKRIGIWDFQNDDFFSDRIFVELKDICTSAIACYRDDIFVGVKQKNEQNVTQHFLFKYTLTSDGQTSKDFRVSTFNEKITAVDVSSNGIYVIAGSSDHNFKCLRLNEGFGLYTHRMTHELGGAVVFISIDPTSTNFAVSSSDGHVRIFSIEDIDSGFEDLLCTADYGVCQSFNPEDGLARLRVCWSPDGDELFIPSRGQIQVISSENWTEKFCIPYEKAPLDLFCSVIYGMNSVFAVNSKDKLVCFDLTTLKSTYEKDIEIDVVKKGEKGQLVSSIAFIDDGCLAIASRTGDVYKHKYESLPSDAVMLDEDEGDIGKLKSQFNTYNYNLDDSNFANQPQQTIVNTKPAVLIEKAQTREILISGAAKESNALACLKWNAFGRILNHVADGERSIEITFNDASVHEEIFLDNQSSRYIFGDLNNSLVALASQRNGNDESELYVRQIGSWDRENQIWTSIMPNGEAIETIAVGQDFIVTYTDLRFIRIYTASGIVRLLFSAPGPLRSLVAGNCFLGLVRDTGGLIIEDSENAYERQYAVDLYQVTPLNSRVMTSIQKSLALALSPEADLNWISFTPSGSLCSMDSLFVVRYLGPDSLWIPVFVGAEILKDAAGDLIWPISLTECDQAKFRYIYCRGRTKPKFEKIEAIKTAKWNIPIENKKNEKGKCEQDLMTNEILQMVSQTPHTVFNVNDRQALATDYQKKLLLLFALCIKKGRDARAFDSASLVDCNTLEIFRTFAAKNGRTVLVKKIENLYNDRSSQVPESALSHSVGTSSAFASSTTISQEERKITLPRKRQQTTVKSTLIGTANSLNASTDQFENSLISNVTPARNNHTLSDVINTQDSLISVDTPIPDRKRTNKTTESEKTAKKQRTSSDFFDSLAD